MARTSQGVTVHVDTDLTSAATFGTQLECPTSIGEIGGGDRAEIDVSTLCSTAKEFILGLKDEGSITMDMPWDPTDGGQAVIQTAADLDGAANSLNFRVTVPADGADPAVTFTFVGAVKKFGKSFAVDDYIKANLEVRLSGAVAIA